MSSQDIYTQQEEKLILRSSRSRMSLMLTVSLLFVLGGIGLIHGTQPQQVIAGILAILFFGLCSLVPLSHLIYPRPVLIVDEAGLHRKTLTINTFIAWEEVGGIIALTEPPYRGLGIYLSEAGKLSFLAHYPRRQRSLEQFPEWPALMITRNLLSVGPKEAVEMIYKRYQHKIEQYHITIQ